MDCQCNLSVFSQEQVATVCEIVEDKCPRPLGRRLWVIVVAYILVFLPWGILALFDFINDRWRKIRVVSFLGYSQLILFFPTFVFVCLYIIWQSEADELTEMSAAIVALSLSTIHFVRTICGMTQLRYLRDWVSLALDMMHFHGYSLFVKDHYPNAPELVSRAVDRASRNISRGSVPGPATEDKFCPDSIFLWMRFFLASHLKWTIHLSEQAKSRDRLRKEFVRNMLMNSSMADNEIYGAENRISWNIFAAAHAAEPLFAPLFPDEIFINWAIPFLAQYGTSLLIDGRMTQPLFPYLDEAIDRNTFARHLYTQAVLLASGNSTCDEKPTWASVWARVTLCRSEASFAATYYGRCMPYRIPPRPLISTRRESRMEGEMPKTRYRRYEYQIKRVVDNIPAETLNRLDVCGRPDLIRLVLSIGPADIESFAIFLHSLTLHKVNRISLTPGNSRADDYGVRRVDDWDSRKPYLSQSMNVMIALMIRWYKDFIASMDRTNRFNMPSDNKPSGRTDFDASEREKSSVESNRGTSQTETEAHGNRWSNFTHVLCRKLSFLQRILGFTMASFSIEMRGVTSCSSPELQTYMFDIIGEDYQGGVDYDQKDFTLFPESHSKNLTDFFIALMMKFFPRTSAFGTLRFRNYYLRDANECIRTQDRNQRDEVPLETEQGAAFPVSNAETDESHVKPNIEHPVRADDETCQNSRKGPAQADKTTDKIKASRLCQRRRTLVHQQLGVENEFDLVPGNCPRSQYSNGVLWGNDAVFETCIHIDNMFAIALGSIFRANHLFRQSGVREIEDYVRNRAGRGNRNRSNKRLSRANYAIQEFALDSKEIKTLKHQYAIYRLGQVTFVGCAMERVRMRLNVLAIEDQKAAVKVGDSMNMKFKVSQILRDACSIMAFKSGRKTLAEEHHGVAERYAFEALVIWECQVFCVSNLERCQLGDALMIVLCILAFPCLATNLDLVEEEKEKQMRKKIVLEVEPVFAPQAVRVRVTIKEDFSMARMELFTSTRARSGILHLRGDGRSVTLYSDQDPNISVSSASYKKKLGSDEEFKFDWNRWRNAFEGRMEFESERLGEDRALNVGSHEDVESLGLTAEGNVMLQHWRPFNRYLLREE